LRNLYTELGDLSSDGIAQSCLKSQATAELPELKRKRLKTGQANETQSSRKVANSPLRSKVKTYTAKLKTAGRTRQSSANTRQPNIVQYCSIQSTHSMFQQSTCSGLNLSFVQDEILTTRITELAVSRTMRTLIYNQTRRTTKVTVYQTGTDGN
jgi:hypothetical protein